MVSVRLKKLAGEAPGGKSNQPRREMQVKYNRVGLPLREEFFWPQGGVKLTQKEEKEG
jgi:hypothetical protein